MNYLHSDLRREDRHFRELSKILRRADLLEERVLINSELIDRGQVVARQADYKIEPDWDNPSDMRYFDLDGNPVLPSIAGGLLLIGECLQHDLLLRINTESELRRAVDIFKKYASWFKLDKYGRRITRKDKLPENKDAVYGASEIPLLICTSSDNRKPKNLRDFIAVNQFDMPEMLGNNRVTVSTITKTKTADLKRTLAVDGIKAEQHKKYALRVFVDDYLDK